MGGIDCQKQFPVYGLPIEVLYFPYSVLSFAGERGIDLHQLPHQGAGFGLGPCGGSCE